MSEWIKVLIGKGKRADKETAGTLLCSDPVVCYCADYASDEISLDGDFSIDQLEALIKHMKAHQ